MIVLPVFFFAFMLIYKPFDVVSYMGGEWFAVHLTIISSIVLLAVIGTRLLYFFLKLRINYTIYALWCVGEILFISLFAGLYLWLALHKGLPYFEVVSTAFKYLCFALIIPYSILALSMRVYEFHYASLMPDDNSLHRIRFYDIKHNLKIVLTPDSICYITANENYVTITYNENGSEKDYSLRTSMKAIDELCQENGLVRCHRSYFINPSYVKVLRKEKEGVIFVEMESRNAIRIPVSKKYYDRLAEFLY